MASPRLEAWNPVEDMERRRLVRSTPLLKSWPAIFWKAVESRVSDCFRTTARTALRVFSVSPLPAAALIAGGCQSAGRDGVGDLEEGRSLAD